MVGQAREVRGDGEESGGGGRSVTKPTPLMKLDVSWEETSRTVHNQQFPVPGRSSEWGRNALLREGMGKRGREDSTMGLVVAVDAAAGDNYCNAGDCKK
jgi:hypothetical protein